MNKYYNDLNEFDKYSFIINSSCEGSNFVFNSTDVVNSNQVHSSKQVQDSFYVFHSSLVQNSHTVIDSENVHTSDNISTSKMIFWCDNIVDSTDCENSSFIMNSEGIFNSILCNNSCRLRECLFCYDLTDAEYHILNKPVSKERFAIIKQLLQNYLTKANASFKLIKDELEPHMVGVFSPIKNTTARQYSIDTFTPELIKSIASLVGASNNDIFAMFGQCL